MLVIQDPIRNALRQLVSDKVIFAWNAMEDCRTGFTEWTVVNAFGGAQNYSTDGVNKLISMHWEAQNGLG